MTDHQFVHLRSHSEYSLVDGILRIKPTLSRVAEDGMPAFALTDLNNLFAAVKFFRAAQSAGIKPILGADLILQGDDDRAFRLTLLVMGHQGYLNLIELLSLAHTEGQASGEPRIQKNWLDQHHAGLICLSGAKFGDVGTALVNNNFKEAKKLASHWASLFKDRFYLEIQRTGRAGDEDHLHAAVKLAIELDLPLVATNDVCFLEADDFEAHEARTCINQGATLIDPRRARVYSEQQYLRSSEEMWALFDDIPEALQNTLQIAKRCNFSLVLGQYFLPAYPTPEGMSEADYLRKVAREGLDVRCEQDIPAEYRDRLETELEIVIEMGFAGYFLIVMDFIRWAKDHAIPVGPGRGSGAGSLVAYALQITDLDPIRYDLLF